MQSRDCDTCSSGRTPVSNLNTSSPQALLRCDASLLLDRSCDPSGVDVVGTAACGPTRRRADGLRWLLRPSDKEAMNIRGSI